MKLRNRYKFFGSLLLASTLLIATTNASSYNLPSANEKAILDDNVLALQKISKGVSFCIPPFAIFALWFAHITEQYLLATSE